MYSRLAGADPAVHHDAETVVPRPCAGGVSDHSNRLFDAFDLTGKSFSNGNGCNMLSPLFTAGRRPYYNHCRLKTESTSDFPVKSNAAEKEERFAWMVRNAASALGSRDRGLGRRG